MPDDKQQSIRIDINAETTPIYYTDNINITINPDGVVLNFCQVVTPNQMKVVARVGMSLDHAKKFVNKMGSLMVNESKMNQGSKIKN